MPDASRPSGAPSTQNGLQVASDEHGAELITEEKAASAAQPVRERTEAGPHEALERYAQEKALTNVALGRAARQSSTSQWSRPDDAAGAVTGTFPPDFAFHTDFEAAPWWEVDLEWLFPVEMIVIHNRIFAAQGRANTIAVHVSPDGETWTLVHAGFVVFGSAKSGMPLTLPLSGALSLRYVRVSSPEQGCLHLSQVEVYVAGEDARLERVTRRLVDGTKPRSEAEAVRLSIVGTSNSILSDGYTVSLKQRSDIELISNLSLGSSHPTFITSRISSLSTSYSDVVVFDLAVNQQLAVTESCFLEELNLSVFDLIASSAAALGYIPLIFLMPEGPSYSGVRKAFAARNNLIELSRRYQLPYLDGYSVVESLAAESGKAMGSFFLDPNHLDRRLAKALGHAVGHSASHLKAEARKTTRTAELNTLIYLPVTECIADGAKLVTRSTSLISTTLLRLNAGEKQVLTLPGGSEIVGLNFNMGRSNGCIRLQGESCLTKNLNTLYAKPDGPTYVVSWSLLESVKAQHGNVEVQCPSCLQNEVVEASDHYNVILVDTEGCTIELAGLIVRTGRTVGDLSYFPGSNLDLWKVLKNEL